MRESYGEDLASHTDPESCTFAREGGREALTGVCAGELLSREIVRVQGADAVAMSGRSHLMMSRLATKLGLQALLPENVR